MEEAHNSYRAPIPLFIKGIILPLSPLNIAINTALVEVIKVIKGYVISVVAYPYIFCGASKFYAPPPSLLTSHFSLQLHSQ